LLTKSALVKILTSIDVPLQLLKGYLPVTQA